MDLNRSLDQYFPFRGPCAICGHPDARHRLFDAIRGRAKAGDSVEELAEDYDASEEAIKLVINEGDSLLWILY